MGSTGNLARQDRSDLPAARATQEHKDPADRRDLMDLTALMANRVHKGLPVPLEWRALLAWPVPQDPQD